MKAIEAVKCAAKRAEMPITAVGPAMGKRPNYVSVTAWRGSTPNADTLARMLNVCGFKLCAVPADNVPGDALIIDAPMD